VAFTLVSFHAHPDDEALLTGGTLARAADEGHRVVLVVATSGEAGLTGPRLDRADLAARREAELLASAAALGCADVHLLGFDDSGGDGRGGRDGHAFARVDVEAAAGRLAAILAAEGADGLTVYDPAGGYGHPDHVQVHRVGVRAAEIAGTPLVLEATVDRRALLRVLAVLRPARLLRLTPAGWCPDRLAAGYAEPARLTHRVDVRAYCDAKRAAMAAHGSQASGGGGPRSLAVYLRLPRWLFRRVFGHEWFVERGRQPAPRLLDDIFASRRT
jgi:LmbE family N-acetylglucosaminyl deacetylase